MADVVPASDLPESIAAGAPVPASDIPTAAASGTAVPSEDLPDAGPSSSDRLPPSPGLLQRYMQGAARAMWFFQANNKALKEGWGSGPIGMSDETRKGLQDAGILSDPSKGQLGVVRAFNDAVVNPLYGTADVLGRLWNAGVGAISSAVGNVVEQTSSDKQPGHAKLAGQMTSDEMHAFLDFLGLDSMTNTSGLARVEAGPNGELRDVPMGGLPKHGDFSAVADLIRDPKVEPILRKLYDEKGVSPAEVLHDMQGDVTVAQDLAAGREPAIYGQRVLPAPSEPTPPAEGASTDLVPAEGGKPPAEPPAEPPTGGGGAAPEPPPREPGKPMSLEEANASVMKNVSVGEHDTTQPMTFDRLYTQTVDSLHPFNMAIRDAMAEIGKQKGELPNEPFTLTPPDNPYILARLTKGLAGKAYQFLNLSPFNFKTYANEGMSLREILKPVSEDDAAFNQFRSYITGKRALELEGRGVQTGFDLEAAKRVAEDPTVTAKFEGMRQQLLDYQNRLTKYLRDSGILSEQAYQAMLKANADYVPFYRMLNPTMALEKGGVRRSTGRGFSPRNPLKAIEGSDLAIADPIESIIKNTYTYLALAEKNAVGRALVDLLKKADERGKYERPVTAGDGPKAPEPGKGLVSAEGAPAPREGEILPPIDSRWRAADALPPPKGKPGSMIEQIPNEKVSDANFTEIAPGVTSEDLKALVQTASREPEGAAISIFRNGVRETYRISDPDLVAAWRGLDAQTVGWLTKVLAMPAHWLRAGATLTPDFIVRNIMRDFFGAFVNSKGALFSPINTMRGIKAILGKSEDFQNWLKGGGANAAMVSLDRRYLQQNLEHLNSTTGLSTRAWNVVKSPLETLRMMSELAENATRVGEFIKQSKGATSKGATQSAAFASREVTVDFARIGAQMRAANMVTAFLNANVQGVDRLARAFKDNPFQTAAKITAGVTIPSILLWMANHNDPRYKEIPNWEKDLFWIVMTKDHIYRIPKPFEVGVLFGSLPERLLDTYEAENPHALDGFATTLLGAFLPGAVPTFALPVAEQWANKSQFTGAPLIPAAQENQLPEYQYNPYTTETAKALGKILGAFPGVRSSAIDENSPFKGVATALTSPILLENWLRDWTGGLGTYALQIADASLRKAGALPDPPKPSDTLADIPVVRAFAVRYPSAGAQSIQSFYDAEKQNATVMTTLQAQAKAGDIEAIKRIQDLYGMRVELPKVQQALGEISSTIRSLYKNPKMTPSDKRQLIDTLYLRMIETAHYGLKIIDDANARLKEPSTQQK